MSNYTGIALGQQINALSFLCLSLTPGTLEQVAQLLGIEDLNTYSTVGSQIGTAVPNDVRAGESKALRGSKDLEQSISDRGK